MKLTIIALVAAAASAVKLQTQPLATLNAQLTELVNPPTEEE